MPESHDGTAFEFELRLSAAPDSISEDTVRESLFNVQGATVSAAVRTSAGNDQGWRITASPTGTDDVRIELPKRACSEANAICSGGESLAKAISTTVSYQQPLTAAFSEVPSEHDGSSAFELNFTLSEEPAGLSYRTVQNGLFTVTDGSIARAWRLERPGNKKWGLKIAPSGLDDVKLVVNDTTDCGGTPGVCTEDGRMLAGGLETTINGPATLSVADAEVDEAQGAGARVRGELESGVHRGGDRGVPHRRRDGNRGSRLHGDERDAHLQHRGHLENSVRAGPR